MAAAEERSGVEQADVVIVGGGIAGLFCAFKLAEQQSRRIVLLERSGRFGGRIETGRLLPAPFAGPGAHAAEFGPMRFELELQPLFARILEQLGISTTEFDPPSSPEPPAEYPLAEDERSRDGVPLSSLELLKLGIYRLFDQEPFVTIGRKGQPVVELPHAGRAWLAQLGDDNSGFDELRRTARLPGTRRLLSEVGFWNALYAQLSPMAVAKILHFGTFYHLMPENPNAAEWAIFWLRLFKLERNKLSTIDAGVDTVTDKLVHLLSTRPNIKLLADHEVTSVEPLDGGRQATITCEDGSTFVATHVILALPKAPLLGLSLPYPDYIRAALDSVIAFPLLKVFCVTETPSWWQADYPLAQTGAWNAPTREVHYFPGREEGDPDWRSPEYTLVLFYTDRPATGFWQPYVVKPQSHESAEIDENPELAATLASVLFNMHWEWAKNKAGLGARTGRHALSSPKGARVAWALGEYFADIIGSLEPADPLWALIEARHPGLVGDPARILFRPEEVLQWQRESIRQYAIRDWSLPPYGAGCHAWAPGAMSWKVRCDLAAFSFAGNSEPKNLHICGEAYSDYQGFIEGALRSAQDAVNAVLAST